MNSDTPVPRCTYVAGLNQTKKAITNKFIQEALTEFIKHQLEIYFIENKLDADKLCEQVLINMRSRVKAESTRLNLKKTLTSSNDMTSRVEKFVDCRSRDVNEREIFIVEGDSALGACKQARDSSFQAIIPVRGKILNCLKSEYDKIFKSDIIVDLIKVLGCGVEVNSKKSKEVSSFNIDDLRWNKVIICTDADVDGFQIRTLILTMIYRLMPTLIKEGKVYIAESPLYEIRYKDETWFCYTEKEKADVLAELGNVKYTIQRSKGLGENDADMMNLTTMNPATRRLIKIDPAEASLMFEKFDLFEGNNLSGRKEFIEKYDAEKYQIAKKGHDLLKMVIEDNVLGHGIKYDYKITEMIMGGYEHYYTSIYFTVYNVQSKTRNNTTFVFNLPHPKNIHLDNCVYANDGKYCLWYKKGCSLNLIKDSYYVNDIKKAFEEFIEGEDNNEI